MSESLKNLTYQALSQENDNIFLSHYSTTLVHSILEAFQKKEKHKIEKTVQISEKIKDKLEMKFDVIKVPAIRIQLGEEESEIEHEPKPTEFSTSLK